MTTGTGIAGAMSYQPRETSDAPNACATCGKDFGEGGRTIAAAIPGIGLVQYCSRECAPARGPAEEWQRMVERIRALEEALREVTRTEASNARRLRDAIVEARQRLEKGRTLWNGPCHECDAVLAQALSFDNDAEAIARAVLTNTNKGES